MIQPFVDRFMAATPDIKAKLSETRPDSYVDLVDRLIKVLNGQDNDYNSNPDPTRITVINHGDYQGTLLFIIGAEGYQPSTYWSIFVDYGSCSGCDAFEAIHVYGNALVTSEEVDGYWTLMLHMVQSMKQL
jgi:hypothetical protein